MGGRPDPGGGGGSTLLWADLRNPYVWIVLLTTLAFGAIGLVDDYRKLVLKNPRGLAARYKYSGRRCAGLHRRPALFGDRRGPRRRPRS